MKLFQCGYMQPFRHAAAFAALSATLTGCTGGVSEAEGRGEEDVGTDDAPPDENMPTPDFVGEEPAECMEGDYEMPATPLRRLSADEAARSLEVALEVDDLGATLPVGVRAPEGFRNDVEVLLTSAQFVQGVDAWADKIAERAGTPAASLAKCNAFGDTCEKKLIRELGRRLLRRPLADGQVTRFQNLFKAAKDQGDDFSVGASLVVKALVASPQFLYRLEPVPDDGTPRKLDGYEVATRLSFLAWGSGPDAELLDAAEKGELDKTEGISKHFARLLQHERAKRGLRTFVSEWLGLDLLPETIRDESDVQLDAELRRDMAEETFRLFEHFLADKETPAWELAVAPFTFSSKRLAQHAGIKSAATENFARVDLPESEPRLGFLTHAGFLTAHAGAAIPKVVERGLTVFKTIMCQTPVPPGANIDTALNQKPIGPGVTERLNADARAANATCGGCHKHFDPLAYAFERFDGTGRWVERDGNGNPLRTDGTMLWMGSPTEVEEEREYDGPREFLQLLSEDVRFRSCLSQKVVQYAWGRGLEPDGKDLCPLYNIHARAARKGSSLQALFAAVVEDPQFRMVRAAP